MEDIRAETVADAFFSGWIAATITADRGAQFESKLWDSLCNQFGIVPRVITPSRMAWSNVSTVN